MAIRWTIFVAILALFPGCSSSVEGQSVALSAAKPSVQDSEAAPVSPSTDSISQEQLARNKKWEGVYTSPSEIGAFTSTTLVITDVFPELHGDLSYRMLFRTDVSMAGEIDQDQLSGTCLVEDDRLYIPRASGHMIKDKAHLSASVERYTLRSINGLIVLMREDARKVFDTRKELYDYGVLIKVADKADLSYDIHQAEHKSIKALYADPTKQWKDPYVHGPQ